MKERATKCAVVEGVVRPTRATYNQIASGGFSSTPTKGELIAYVLDELSSLSWHKHIMDSGGNCGYDGCDLLHKALSDGTITKEEIDAAVEAK